MHQRFPRLSLRSRFVSPMAKRIVIWVKLDCAHVCSLQFWTRKTLVTFLKYLESVYSTGEKYVLRVFRFKRTFKRGIKAEYAFFQLSAVVEEKRIDKKTAWATLKPPRKDLQIETLGDRSVENFVGAENKRNTTSVARFSSNPIACRYIHDPSLKVDRISLNSNVYRNGVFADEYLCFFSRNLTRERERENHSRFEDAIRAALLAVFRFQFRFRLVDSDLVPSTVETLELFKEISFIAASCILNATPYLLSPVVAADPPLPPHLPLHKLYFRLWFRPVFLPFLAPSTFFPR